MSKTIWKYSLQLQDVQAVAMPDMAEILTADFQGNDLCLWAVVQPERPMKPRQIVIYGTGHPMPERCDDFYITTIQQAGGALIWHVFERK